MAVEMERLAKQKEGFIGIDSARDEVGITVSYCRGIKSIKVWNENLRALRSSEIRQGKRGMKATYLELPKWSDNILIRGCCVLLDRNIS